MSYITGTCNQLIRTKGQGCISDTHCRVTNTRDNAFGISSFALGIIDRLNKRPQSEAKQTDSNNCQQKFAKWLLIDGLQRPALVSGCTALTNCQFRRQTSNNQVYNSLCGIAEAREPCHPLAAGGPVGCIFRLVHLPGNRYIRFHNTIPFFFPHSLVTLLPTRMTEVERIRKLFPLGPDAVCMI